MCWRPDHRLARSAPFVGTNYTLPRSAVGGPSRLTTLCNDFDAGERFQLAVGLRNPAAGGPAGGGLVFYGPAVRAPSGGRQASLVSFSELQLHYLFADRFGRPGKGNARGKVDGLVGLIRRNYLVPIPHDAWEKRAGRVRSLSLVRYRSTDYSVPTAYGHREVLIRGDIHEVVISCGADMIARHRHQSQRRRVLRTWAARNRSAMKGLGKMTAARITMNSVSDRSPMLVRYGPISAAT